MDDAPGPAGPSPHGAWVIDLDGVVWLTGEPIAGAPEAVARLRRGGGRVLFATNNASPRKDELLGRLHRAGIEAGPDDVASAAEAAATMVEPGERVMVVGDDGLEEALGGAGAVPADDDRCTTVMVARTDRFDYQVLDRASRRVREGARLIGTSEDPTHPTPTGLVPGSGAVLAAVATAAGTAPEVAGKPHRAMCELITRRVGDVHMVVGDRADTDGEFARRLGARFALVYSGATAAGDPLTVRPDVAAADLAALVARVQSDAG